MALRWKDRVEGTLWLEMILSMIRWPVGGVSDMQKFSKRDPIEISRRTVTSTGHDNEHTKETQKKYFQHRVKCILSAVPFILSREISEVTNGTRRRPLMTFHTWATTRPTHSSTQVCKNCTARYLRPTKFRVAGMLNEYKALNGVCVLIISRVKLHFSTIGTDWEIPGAHIHFSNWKSIELIGRDI